MLAVPAGITILLFLPLKHQKGNHVAKLKKIDYGGIVLNLAAVLLILVRPVLQAHVCWGGLADSQVRSRSPELVLPIRGTQPS